MSKQHTSPWSTKHERARLRRKIRLQLQPASQTTVVLQHISGMCGMLNRPGRYESLAHYQYVREGKLFWKQYKAELCALERLRKKRFVQVEKRKNGYFVSLSTDGKVELLKLKIKSCQKRLPSDCRCLVLFDIPESAKAVRDDFRQLMKRCGFVLVQKSAWSSAYNVGEDMRELIHLLGVEDWVQVFLARQVS